MDTKFSAHYWSHPQVEPAGPDIKLAGAWMRTNDRVTLFGYVEVTPARFAFETGLPPETLARAIEALSEWFVRTPRGYFMPDYIREQIGSGESLVRNLVCKPLLRALVALNDAAVLALVLRNYPELETVLRIDDSKKPFQSPSQGAEKSREEQNRAEQSSEGDRGVGKEERGKRTTVPSEHPKLGPRLIAVAAIKGRGPKSAWTFAELEALRDAGLDTLSDQDFEQQVATMRSYYAAKIPREIPDFRRKTIRTLLENWPGELDQARVFNRDHNDGITIK